MQKENSLLKIKIEELEKENRVQRQDLEIQEKQIKGYFSYTLIKH